jgi:hypothetical protein
VLNELPVWLVPAFAIVAGMLSRRVQWWTMPERFKR